MTTCMKRLVTLLIVFLSALAGVGQTMSVELYNGQTLKVPVSGIKTITFTDDTEPSSDASYYEFTLDGKKYKYDIPYARYVEQFATDASGKLLSVVQDAIDRSGEHGFLFAWGVIFYNNGSDLLASSAGTYKCCTAQVKKDKSYENLMLYPAFRYNGADYEVSSGTHQVTAVEKTTSGVRLEGNFTLTFTYNNDVKEIAGNYRLVLSSSSK